MQRTSWAPPGPVGNASTCPGELARPAWRPDRHRAFEHDQPLLLAEVPVIGQMRCSGSDQVDRAAELLAQLHLRERPLPVPAGLSVPSVQSSS